MEGLPALLEVGVGVAIGHTQSEVLRPASDRDTDPVRAATG